MGKGYKVAIETLNQGRIGIGAQMIGLAGGALERALVYSRERHSFGRPIAAYQGVSVPPWPGWRPILKRRAFWSINAARLRDSGLPFLTEAAMAKYFSAEVG